MSRVADVVGRAGEAEESLSVILSSELIGLLSQQLYKSPIKALEELVVNAYDADATECRIGLPSGGGGLFWNSVFVFDDGLGMDHTGLADLWHVGHSKKKGSRLSKLRQRKQIGKFGIGKLATYSLAHQVTYITRSAEDLGLVRSTTLDYRKFMSDPQGGSIPVQLPVRRFDVNTLLDNREFIENLEAVSIDPSDLLNREGWTLVILEDLREAVQDLQRGRLEWVLSTAMPLGDEFRCYVNGELIKSSKENFDVVASFSVAELPTKRVESLKDTTGEEWRVEEGKLVSNSFPAGIEGTVLVTVQSLYGQKSDDLVRSNGFFVRVRGRLVNLDDPLFGMRPLSYETFSRFRAEVSADDLDTILTAPREGVEQSLLRKKFTQVLETLYYEARSRYDQRHRDAEKQEKNKNEGERNYVNPRYVERPVADALIVAAAEQVAGTDGRGADADGEWFYLDLPAGSDLSAVASSLYTEQRQDVYRYERVNKGRSGRMVSFDAKNSVFYLNADHDLIRSHDDNAGARKLLQDIVSAEALLEVYLRERGMPAHIVGEVLEQRDQLLRSLTRDNIYSMNAIAQELRESGSDERDLEVNLVVAARALGFVAKHLSGGGNPDGVARLADYPNGEKVITLEAKSSVEVPSLGAIDFAGLHEHVKNEDADGCLLVAPSYPGRTLADSAAARRAENLRISCWTVQQLSDVLEAAESRHLTARHVLAIVLTKFKPDDVSAAVEELLTESKIDNRLLYRAVIAALRELEGRVLDQPRSKIAVSVTVSLQEGFGDVKASEVNRAIEDLAGASRGGMDLSGELILLHVSIDELERRLGPLLGDPGVSRGPGTFRM